METQESRESSLTGDQHDKPEVAMEHHAAVDSSDVSDDKTAEDQTLKEEPSLTEMKATSDESNEATYKVFIFSDVAHAPASSVLVTLAVRRNLQMGEKEPLTNGSGCVFGDMHGYTTFFAVGGGGLSTHKTVQNDRDSAPTLSLDYPN
jgi:hypothetical protein